jgi:hypothetical protein
LSQQLAQGVPGDYGLAVGLGHTGLYSAEPAVADDHVRMGSAEPSQPDNLVKLVRDRPQAAAYLVHR